MVRYAWLTQPTRSAIALEGWYEAVEYSGEDMIESSMFPTLELTAEKVLQG